MGPKSSTGPLARKSTVALVTAREAASLLLLGQNRLQSARLNAILKGIPRSKATLRRCRGNQMRSLSSTWKRRRNSYSRISGLQE